MPYQESKRREVAASLGSILERIEAAAERHKAAGLVPVRLPPVKDGQPAPEIPLPCVTAAAIF
jgi:hypothetical protein